MKSLKAFFPGETYIEYGFPFALQTLPRKTVETALTLALLGWKITEKKDSSDEKTQPEMNPASKSLTDLYVFENVVSVSCQFQGEGN